MKRITTILMLMVFLFNVGGYYLALFAVEYTTTKALTARINNEQYTAQETVEIRIPISLPYPLQQRGFERVQGKFEYNGEFYQLIKQKLDGETLVIICIRNQEQKQAVEAVNDYVTLANDLPGTAKKALTFIGKIIKDYEPSSTEFLLSSRTESPLVFSEPDERMILTYLDIISPPPKA